MLGRCPPAYLATVPDGQFSEGQADGRGQGLSGWAKWGRAAGVWDLGILNQLLWQVWPAWPSRVHQPPGGSPASCWRVWGGQAGHSPGQQSQQRVDGAGGRRRPHTPCGSPALPTRTGTAAHSSGSRVLAPNPRLSIWMTWEILTRKQKDWTVAPVSESVCERLAPPGGKCLLCSEGFCTWGPEIREPGPAAGCGVLWSTESRVTGIRCSPSGDPGRAGAWWGWVGGR